MSETDDLIVIDPMSVDQFAGAIVLILGAVGSLLLVIWQSRCACRCRIGLSDKCYVFDCSREPPPADLEKGKDKKKIEKVDSDGSSASPEQGAPTRSEKIIPTPRDLPNEPTPRDTLKIIENP